MQIVGPNGIGKSSLIQILAGLRRSSWSADLAGATNGKGRGRVSWTGPVGLIDQRCALDPERPLGEALRFWQNVDGCSNPDFAIETMGLSDLLEVPVRYLSTGQRKRAAFASLLNRGVSNWLLDEPLNGLDADACATVEALIKLHCNGGGTCIAASHQPIDLPDAHIIALEDYAL